MTQLHFSPIERAFYDEALRRSGVAGDALGRASSRCGASAATPPSPRAGARASTRRGQRRDAAQRVLSLDQLRARMVGWKQKDIRTNRRAASALLRAAAAARNACALLVEQERFAHVAAQGEARGTDLSGVYETVSKLREFAGRKHDWAPFSSSSSSSSAKAKSKSEGGARTSSRSKRSFVNYSEVGSGGFNSDDDHGDEEVLGGAGGDTRLTRDQDDMDRATGYRIMENGTMRVEPSRRRAMKWVDSVFCDNDARQFIASTHTWLGTLLKRCSDYIDEAKRAQREMVFFENELGDRRVVLRRRCHGRLFVVVVVAVVVVGDGGGGGGGFVVICICLCRR